MAVGHLVSFWLWATKYAQDGKLGKHTHRALARGGKWHGDPDTFVESMFHAGWLDGHDDGLHIHDWHDYAGRLIDMRAANRARMRAKRATHVQRTTAAQPAHVQGLPNQTKPNLTKPEEKKEPESFISVSDLPKQPPRAYQHPVMQAVKAKRGHIRWIGLEQGIEPPERQATEIALVDDLVATYGQAAVIAAYQTATAGAVSFAEARKKAADYLHKQYPEKAAPRAETARKQYGEDDSDWSHMTERIND
jgi:hypothetical protein